MARGKINYYIKPDTALAIITGPEARSSTEIMKSFFAYIKAHKLGYSLNKEGKPVFK